MPACEEQRTSIFDEFRSQHRQCAEAAANLVVVADSDFGFRPRWDFGLFGASCERGTRELSLGAIHDGSLELKSPSDAAMAVTRESVE